MAAPPNPMSVTADTRLGLHYFPDTLHYRQADLQLWLPELKSLGVAWLVLRTDLNRAIPEAFLRGLKQAGIEPIIQFQLSPEHLPARQEIATLFDVYARWGARYIVLFDRPNARAAWPVSGWVQQDLVERFLDRFLPVAALALGAGLTPVFPPLDPGGNYWDTAFLRSSLQGMLRRKQDALLQRMAISAYAWSNGHSLDWGAGGPERWPQVRPYQNSAGQQDQRGFRVFEWYAAVANSVLQRQCPIILFQAGAESDPTLPSPILPDADLYAADCSTIVRLLEGEPVVDPLEPENMLEPVTAQVIACNFWLLGSSQADHPMAWFQETGHRAAAAEVIRSWRVEQHARQAAMPSAVGAKSLVDTGRLIHHYLLLPGHEWGISDWYLEIIRPFVKKHRPTVGFSIEEAACAGHVTMIGNPRSYPEGAADRLRAAGCWVEVIDGDGIEIATQMAAR
jgi:hypothetical protein